MDMDAHLSVSWQTLVNIICLPYSEKSIIHKHLNRRTSQGTMYLIIVIITHMDLQLWKICWGSYKFEKLCRLSPTSGHLTFLCSSTSALSWWSDVSPHPLSSNQAPLQLFHFIATASSVMSSQYSRFPLKEQQKSPYTSFSLNSTLGLVLCVVPELERINIRTAINWFSPKILKQAI